MGRVTRITIDIHHDRLNGEWRKDVDLHVGENTLKIYHSHAWHLLQSAVSSGQAETKIEVVQE